MKRFICVILVFTLFIACTVRPAYAVDVGTVSVALEAFISAALIGLGLSPQAGNNTAFNEIVTNCKNFLQEASIVAGDVMILLYPSPGMTYAKRDVIQKIKDWLFSSNTIPSAQIQVNSFSLNMGEVVATGSKPVYYIPLISHKVDQYGFDTYWFFSYFCSEESFSLQNIAAKGTTITGTSYYAKYCVSNGYFSLDEIVSQYSKYFYSGDQYILVEENEESLGATISDYCASVIENGGIACIDGISFSDVVPQVGEDIEITYIDWKELEKQVQEGDGSSEDPTDPSNPAPIPLVPYWPLWSPQFFDPDASLDDVTQQDVWTNASDSSWDPSNSGENSESSPDIPSLTIDLRKFFPFCIPFDIYDIFVAFAADPVAPHFQWDIDIWNYTWSVDIDLSAWDEVASILRRLELLAFIVGLGLVTRDKFLRG